MILVFFFSVCLIEQGVRPSSEPERQVAVGKTHVNCCILLNLYNSWHSVSELLNFRQSPYTDLIGIVVCYKHHIMLITGAYAYKGVSVLSVYGFCCNCIYVDNLHRFTFISMYIATTSSTSILCSAVCSIESLIWNATFCMGIICFILNFVSLIAGSWMYDYKLNFNVVCRLWTSKLSSSKVFLSIKLGSIKEHMAK